MVSINKITQYYITSEDLCLPFGCKGSEHSGQAMLTLDSDISTLRYC